MLEYKTKSEENKLGLSLAILRTRSGFALDILFDRFRLMDQVLCSFGGMGSFGKYFLSIWFGILDLEDLVWNRNQNLF